MHNLVVLVTHKQGFKMYAKHKLVHFTTAYTRYDSKFSTGLVTHVQCLAKQKLAEFVTPIVTHRHGLIKC